MIGALVRKGLIGQTPDLDDQRQKVLQITTAGRNLCVTIPAPIGLINNHAGKRGTLARSLGFQPKMFAEAGSAVGARCSYD